MSIATRTLESLNSYLADGIQTVWPISFSYIDPSHVKAVVMSSAGVQTSPAVTVSGSQATLVPAVPYGSEVTIYRATPTLAAMVDFTDKAMLSEASLDLNAKQAVYAAADARDWASLHSDYSNGQFAQNQVTLAAAQAIFAQTQATNAAASAASIVPSSFSKFAEGGGPFRNRLVNAGMRVAQRGIQNVASPTVSWGVDHFFASVTATTATWSVRQSAGLTPASDAAMSLTPLTTTGTTTVQLGTRAESAFVADMSGQTVTFSARVAQGTGQAVTFTPRILRFNAKDVSGSATVIATGAPQVVTGAQTLVTMTVVLGPTDAANGLQFELNSSAMTALTGATITTSEWQFELGNRVSPFQNVDAALDLLRCQRYYQTVAGYATGIAWSTGAVAFSWYLPTSMRVTPTTIPLVTTSNFLTTTNTAVPGTWGGATVIGNAVFTTFTRTTGTWTAGQALMMQDIANPFALSAEL